ncbi:hypothetical protein MPSEU_000590600 [Mayamaea pseudoterrestris]|nr:hypothetical protein MPSEU_000590600 [Mayamaea pseudoterrestris]
MPGPKMGPRPFDFDETIVRQSPTFTRWLKLQVGETLRYACRTFCKGHGDDEERLMRRIMIARRNNIRDHELLKQARKQQKVQNANSSNSNDDTVAQQQVPKAAAEAASAPSDLPLTNIKSEPQDAAGTNHDTVATAAATGTYDSSGDVSDTSSSNPLNPLLLQHAAMITGSNNNASAIKRKTAAAAASAAAPSTTTLASALALTDAQVEAEMDVRAVEATRSYKTWMALQPGQEFCYNQKYSKGKEGHDWLLRKNIWRRMRYRRENKKLVQTLRIKSNSGGDNHENGLDAGSGNNKRRRINSSERQNNQHGSSMAAAAAFSPLVASGGNALNDYVSQRPHKTSLDSAGGSESEMGQYMSNNTDDGFHHSSNDGNIAGPTPLPAHVTSETAAALAASVMDGHSQAGMLDAADACLTDPDAIAAAVAAGESFGKSQQQQQNLFHHDDDDHDDLEMHVMSEDAGTSHHHHHLVHDPLALDDAAATAAKLAEAEHLYGAASALDVGVDEAEV